MKEDPRIKEWRKKAEEGILTQEELKEAILLIREGRVSACFASAGSKVKKEKTSKKLKVEESMAPPYDKVLDSMKDDPF